MSTNNCHQSFPFLNCQITASPASVSFSTIEPGRSARNELQSARRDRHMHRPFVRILFLSLPAAPDFFAARPRNNSGGTVTFPAIPDGNLRKRVGAV